MAKEKSEKKAFKTVPLSIKERNFISALLSEFKGGVEKLGYILKDSESIFIKDEEWVKLGRTYRDAGGKVILGKDGKPAHKLSEVPVDKLETITSQVWDLEKEKDKDVDFSYETYTYLVESLKKKDKEGEFSINDTAVISIFEKMVV